MRFSRPRDIPPIYAPLHHAQRPQRVAHDPPTRSAAAFLRECVAEYPRVAIATAAGAPSQPLAYTAGRWLRQAGKLRGSAAALRQGLKQVLDEGSSEWMQEHGEQLGCQLRDRVISRYQDAEAGAGTLPHHLWEWMRGTLARAELGPEGMVHVVWWALCESRQQQGQQQGQQQQQQQQEQQEQQQEEQKEKQQQQPQPQPQQQLEWQLQGVAHGPALIAWPCAAQLGGTGSGEQASRVVTAAHQVEWRSTHGVV
jgi:hypothetical protein